MSDQSLEQSLRRQLLLAGQREARNALVDLARALNRLDELGIKLVPEEIDDDDESPNCFSAHYQTLWAHAYFVVQRHQDNDAWEVR